MASFNTRLTSPTIIQNIDLPHTKENYDVEGYIIPATFYPVETMGPCRIIPNPLSFGRVLVVSVEDVYKYDCFLYGSVAIVRTFPDPNFKLSMRI